ncbi:hypothetical protein [uncultured Kocuria sp.]|nr:hypothetical protein [uncultured Kocuria sp.]
MTRQDVVRQRQATHRLPVLRQGEVWADGVLDNSTPDPRVSHRVDNVVGQ